MPRKLPGLGQKACLLCFEDDWVGIIPGIQRFDRGFYVHSSLLRVYSKRVAAFVKAFNAGDQFGAGRRDDKTEQGFQKRNRAD